MCRIGGKTGAKRVLGAHAVARPLQGGGQQRLSGRERRLSGDDFAQHADRLANATGLQQRSGFIQPLFGFTGHKLGLG
jgi:hypothetical protein